MRTAAEIKADLDTARRAYEAMTNVEGAEPEGRGIFLDNVWRDIQRLEKELASVA